MSRLRRNIVRRDRACTLCEKAQDKQILNVEPKLIAFLQDIPSSAFEHAKKPTPEWETFFYVAKTATLAGLWDMELDSVEQVMPRDDEVIMNAFRNHWDACKQDKATSIQHFLDLIKKYELV